MFSFTIPDFIALVWFVVAWLGFGLIVDLNRFHRPSLSQLMDAQRREWMEVFRRREVRIVDTAIMTSLQNGTAFFASTSLLALGGAFTLLNQTDRMMQIFQDLPFHAAVAQGMLETKIVGLVGIYGYAFFKFGWSYRLFNYSAILLGAVPTPRTAEPESVDRALRRAAEMQIDAGHHFHWGLRALFFSVGFFGWFVNAWVFMGATTVVLAVLLRRQFMSHARWALLGAVPSVFLDAGQAQGAGQKAEDLPVDL
jgi:uncharacterized membrane protein